jgi:hypothetical protein
MMSHQDHPAYYYYHQPTSHPYGQEHYEQQHQQQQLQCHPASLHSDTHKDTQLQQEEEVASFLLSLKHNHRSITPEPGSSWSEKSVSSPLIDYHQPPVPQNTSSIPLEKLLHKSNSMLVSLQDADLVPDALFLAMAQMIPTRMTFQDRVGCYKSRNVGYLGMCCKHCGGQPGFGRYFPNSVRSLAQTTTSQTILKHIGSKCRHCPEELKRVVAQLLRLQEQREADSGRPRYGSRKVFFQRVWDRLHKLERQVPHGDESLLGRTARQSKTKYHHSLDTKYDDASSSQTPSDVDEDQTLEAWPSHDTDEVDMKAKHDQMA